MAKMEVCGAGGSTRNSPTFQPFPSLSVGKGHFAAPTSPTTWTLPTISPPPTNQMHNRPWPAVYKSALSDTNHFVTYSSPKSGASVDVWKKVAKKAELELHLELNNHRADTNKDHHLIHRLNRRMIPMEKALGKSKATVKQQVKLIEDLKSKMMSASEKTESEFSFLRHQNQNMQRYLAHATEKNHQKITELEEELREAKSRADTLQEQMDQIYEVVNELPEVVNKFCSGECEEKASRPSDRGLVVMANVKVICHNNEQLKKYLKDRDEKLAVIAEENERLRRVTDKAASRSNKLVQFAASLSEERDKAVTQLKDTEDMVASMQDLESFVNSCTSPRDTEPTLLPQNPTSSSVHVTLPSQILHSKSATKHALHWTEETPIPNLTEEKNEVPLSSAKVEDTTDLSAMRAGPGSAVVYCKPITGEDIRNIGLNMIIKLHAAFRLMSSKVESAKKVTSSLKKENEELRSTLQEAYEGLKGEKLSKSIAVDDYSVALLMAIRELDNSTEDLRKEKAVLEALKLHHENKILDLEGQTQNLTLDRKALLEGMEEVKNVMRASNAGQKPVSYTKDFFNRSRVQGESLTEVLEMVEKLIQERNEARSTSMSFKEDTELKEEELVSLKILYARSHDGSKELQAERDTLDVQLQDLKKDCQALLKEKDLYVQSQDRCKLLQTEKDNLEVELQELRNHNQNRKADNVSEGETLKACEKKLSELQAHIDSNSLDRSALSDTLKTLKCTLKAANLGGRGASDACVKEKEEDYSGKLDMARQLEEISEARSDVGTFKQQVDLKDRELSELRELYHESKSLCVQLQSDIDALESAMQDLHNSVQSIKKVLDDGMASSDLEEAEKRKKFWKADGLVHEKVVREVSSVVQRLHTAERKIFEMEDVLGIKLEPCSDLQSKAANILVFLKSRKYSKLAYVALEEFKELHLIVKQHLKVMADLLAETDSTSFPVAEEINVNKTVPSEGDFVNFDEDLEAASDFKRVVEVLPSLIQKIRKLKTENDTLPATLQALEVENLAITCRSREDQEKMQNLRPSSHLEIEDLRKELDAAQSLISSVLSTSSGRDRTILNITPEQRRGGQIWQTPLLRGLVAVRDDLFDLRAEISGAGVKTGELELQYASEREKAKDLARLLSTTEAHTQTLWNRALVSEAAVQNSTSQIEALQEDLRVARAELGKADELEKKLYVQEEFLTAQKSNWTRLIEDHRKEIVRLGGSDMVDEREKRRRIDAAEKVKTILSNHPHTSSPQMSTGASARISLLTTLTSFSVDLLVNGKVFTQLEVGGSTGGLCSGVIHYFSVDAQTGNISFADSVMPGSQSSNMVADVSFIPKDGQNTYRTEPGDVLGLQVKVSSIEDPHLREALYNTNIVRTNQVLDAIKGLSVETFTLWPDLVSSWRWEREKTKENSWNLTNVRWRFLMKNIFPNLSESLQALAIPGSSARPRVSTIVAI